MMPQIVRTSRAELDLAEIWTYFARDNPDAADRLIRHIDRRTLVFSRRLRYHQASVRRSGSLLAAS